MGYRIIKTKCNICGREINQCADRYNEEYKYFCYECIPEKYHLKCSCGKYFGSNSPSVKLCPECREKQYSIINCYRCGKELKILKKQITGKNVCKKCNSIINGKKALISYNKSEKGRKKSAEIGRRTIKIAHKYQVQNNKIRFCNKCGKETMHLSGVGCMRCHNNSEVMVNATIQRNLFNWKNDPEYRKRISSNLGIEPNFQYKDNVLFYKGIEWNNFCSKLNSGELNSDDYPGIEKRLGVWTYNFIDPLTNDKILLNAYFNSKNDVLFYRNMEWNYFCHLLDSGELNPNDYPGIEKRLDKWVYNKIDPLTNEKILLNANFIKKNNVLFYKNIPWDLFCSKLDSGELNYRDYPGIENRLGVWTYNRIDPL